MGLLGESPTKKIIRLMGYNESHISGFTENVRIFLQKTKTYVFSNFLVRVKDLALFDLKHGFCAKFHPYR